MTGTHSTGRKPAGADKDAGSSPGRQDAPSPAGWGWIRRYRDAVGAGPYEDSLARAAAGENLLVVLPAGRARNVIALAVLDYLLDTAKQMQAASGHHKADLKPVLLIASSREMIRRCQNFLWAEAGIAAAPAIHGRVSAKRRERLWRGGDVVCATPDMFLADMRRGIVSPDRFGLAVFVEARRAVGRHAYAEAARRLSCDTRILAVTDALPRKPGRGAEMLAALRVARVAGRPECGPGEPAGRGRPAVEWVTVDLPPEFAPVRDCLMRALHDACSRLRERGWGDLEDPPRSRLIGVFAEIMESAAPAGAARDAVFARCLLDVLDAYGPAPFLIFHLWCSGQRSTHELSQHPLVVKAIGAAREARDGGMAHPKMDRLAGMLTGPGRTLVVAGQFGSVADILQSMRAAGIPAAGLFQDAGIDDQVRAEREEAVGGLRGGRYRALVSQDVVGAYAGVGDGRLVPGDVDLVVFCAGGADEVWSAAGCGASRVAVLVTKGSYEDPDGWAAAQLDWRMAKTIEDNRRQEAEERDGCAGHPDGTGLAAQDRGRPKYQLLRYRGADAVLGPAGATGTFVEAVGRDGKVRVLLGGIVGRRGGLVLYAVYYERSASRVSRRAATWKHKVPAYALLAKLESQGRNVDGIPTKKYRALLKRRISVGDCYAITQALRRSLNVTVPQKNLPRNKLARLIRVGILGQDGRRLALYVTAEGRLYNGLADGGCPEGRRKILDYMLLDGAPSRRQMPRIRRYVESVADKVMIETRGRLKFIE